MAQSIKVQGSRFIAYTKELGDIIALADVMLVQFFSYLKVIIKYIQTGHIQVSLVFGMLPFFLRRLQQCCSMSTLIEYALTNQLHVQYSGISINGHSPVADLEIWKEGLR